MDTDEMLTYLKNGVLKEIKGGKGGEKMYCNRCGCEIKGGRFCPKCGNQIIDFQQDSGNRQKIEEVCLSKNKELLYQGKGCAKRLQLIWLIVSIYMAIMTIICLFVRNIKITYIGGWRGYVYSDEGRMFFLLLAIMFLWCSILFLNGLQVIRKMTIRLYNDYLEFSPYGLSVLFGLKRVRIYYNDIIDYIVSNRSSIIILNTNNKQYRLACCDVESIIRILKSKI